MFPVNASVGLLPYLLILSSAGLLIMFTDISLSWTAIEGTVYGTLLMIGAKIFFCVHVAIFIWRIVLFCLYRPIPPLGDADTPTCTVIVPAYNEGRQVFDTLRSIVQSDYPPEKLSIIGIDDGSADDTWFWLKKAANQFPGRIRLFRQPMNLGKRHALHRGFSHGDGEVFVTIDSDSQVDPQTLRRLVAPIKRDPRVGAVAGNVRILNLSQGAIPKMLDVSFTYSFDFLRAGQSVVNSVLCTPGALSAYRRSVVMKVLKEWVNQEYCGRPANIGEDRAMTNLILKTGYHVRYQREAMVYTTVPLTVTKLWKMLLRWARSNIRETLVICRFAFRKFRQESALGLRINVLASCMNLTMGQIMHLMAFGLIVTMPWLVLPKMVLAAAVASCGPGIFHVIRYQRSNAGWAVPYSYLWMLCLSWISLYALISPHKNGWMTRNDSAIQPSTEQPPGKAYPSQRLGRAV
jgi:hyaluronan synthase